jgi:hypothetical protein
METKNKIVTLDFGRRLSQPRRASREIKPLTSAASREEKWQVAPAEPAAPAVIFDPKKCTENDF